MVNNNGLLKNIAKNTGSTITGVHGDNYYLRRIEENTQGGISSSGGGSVDLSTYAKKSDVLNLTDVTTLDIVITYDDDSTETKTLYCVKSD
ncbi:MAG: hypothetical protein J6M91_03915 [Methanobrevibacter sp.]|nr:hypothetical protein [Methanobrevibacter sp.]